MAVPVAHREANEASTPTAGPWPASAGAWPTGATASRVEIVHGVRNDPARVHTADEATLGAWRDFLNRADYACHYVAPEFFDEKRFATQDPFALLVWQGDLAREGGWPLVGIPMVAVGLVASFGAPKALARKWRTPPVE